jgi:hypothetical protein
MRGTPVSRHFPRRACLSACRHRVAATRPRHAVPLARLKGAVGTARRRPDSRLPTTRLASRAPTALSPTASPCTPPAAAVHSRPRVSERADTVVYLVRAPVSTPRHRVLAPPGRANPLHHRPHRSPPNCYAPVAAEPPCLPTPLSMPRSSCHAAVHTPVRPRHALLGCLPCASEVAAAVQERRTVVCARARAVRCAGRPS